MGLASPEELMELFFLDDTALRAWVGPGPVMTDDRPYIEYFLSLPGGHPAWSEYFRGWLEPRGLFERVGVTGRGTTYRLNEGRGPVSLSLCA